MPYQCYALADDYMLQIKLIVDLGPWVTVIVTNTTCTFSSGRVKDQNTQNKLAKFQPETEDITG